MSSQIYITGFSAFDDVENNPTSKLCEDLANKYHGHPRFLGSQVLEVSAQAIESFLPKLYDQIEQMESNENVLVIHLGLDKFAEDSFKLETVAYNEATFRCPDEQGWLARHYSINSKRALRAIRQTDLPLASLKERMVTTGYDVVLSEDPGRFLCNWMYYRSLECCRHLKLNKGRNVHAMFVHVPPFEKIPEGEQVKFLMRMVDEISELVEHEDMVINA